MSTTTVYTYGPISPTIVSASQDTTTTSSTDILIDSMSVTPVAGRYFIMFRTSIESSLPGADTYFSIYVDDDQIPGTEVKVTPFPTGLTLGGASLSLAVITNAFYWVNGSQSIEVRWRRTFGTSTAHQRILTLLRLA